jgi:hypothetical protein
MAKKRAVEPDQLGKTAYAQLLPTIMSAFTLHLATFSLDYTANLEASLNP